jgi:hypothetical protein
VERIDHVADRGIDGVPLLRGIRMGGAFRKKRVREHLD